jgi:hypothetical protein
VSTRFAFVDEINFTREKTEIEIEIELSESSLINVKMPANARLMYLGTPGYRNIRDFSDLLPVPAGNMYVTTQPQPCGHQRATASHRIAV